MALSKNSSKKFNAAAFRASLGTALGIVLPFADFFYILQQEEYDSGRYAHWLSRFFFRRNFQERDRLRYTKRVVSSLAVAVVLWLGTWEFFLYLVPPPDPAARFLSVVLWLFLIPIFVLIANWLLTPYYNLAKRSVMRRAAQKIGESEGLKIVAIAGSFGKTTVKNFIYDLVRYNYATQMIPGNINTPLGIGRWVLGSLQRNTKLLIVEADAYKKGEIAASVAVAPPDIAIVTNVGDQHLARFGSKECLAAALKEAFLGAKPEARLLCTAKTAAVFGSLPGRGDNPEIIIDKEELGFLSEAALARFSASNRMNLDFAIKTAELLDVPRLFIIDTCSKLELPDRRQKIATWHGYQCVDDSYNISFTTALAGLDAARELARREGKNMLVVTAGIPEFGPDGADDNIKLGEVVAAKADHAVILRSIFADEIAEGIGEKSKYSITRDFKSFLGDAHAAFPPERWVILLQPELTDLYY